MRIEVVTETTLDDFDGELKEPRLRHMVHHVEVELKAAPPGTQRRTSQSDCGSARVTLDARLGGEPLVVVLLGKYGAGSLKARRPGSSPKWSVERCGLTPAQSKKVHAAGCLALQAWWDAQETLDEECDL